MKILIIEDDAGIRELLKQELEDLGHKIKCVQSGNEAISWLEANSIYLMVIDYGLPDMNGEELIYELKQKDTAIPDFIVATGQGDERIAVDMMKLGARDYVVKDSHFIEMLTKAVTRANKEIENENKLKAAEKALKEMEDKLRQAHKMEAIGTITGGIAHDFNNILGIIIGNTELALDNVPEWNPAYINIKEIKNASLRAADIVKQLLSFSRKTGHILKPIEIISVIKDAVNFIRSTIPSTIEIRKNIPESGQIVVANPVQINQVIMNLCINASQAMEETGGILEINVENVNIVNKSPDNFFALSTGKYIKIIVKDTGPGIDSDIIDRIFDPYFTTKEVGKGSGMGLAVVHGIVINHNGAINVESKPGKGTCFTVLFPLAKEKPEKNTEIQTTDKLPGGNESILFVDDENLLVDMAKQMIERLGYLVETSTDPINALELFKSKPDKFDLVITDMTMPHITGVKLSEKIKKIRSDMPVIICSGHNSGIDEEKAARLNIDAYIMKPFAKKILARTIRSVLDKTNKEIKT